MYVLNRRLCERANYGHVLYLRVEIMLNMSGKLNSRTVIQYMLLWDKAHVWFEIQREAKFYEIYELMVPVPV